MICLFIGGPLDGELREVDKEFCRTQPPPGAVREVTITTLTVFPTEYASYRIANGIARHEAVSEEEVARRVHRWMAAYRRYNWTVTDSEGRELDIVPNGPAYTQRYMRPQFPMGEEQP